MKQSIHRSSLANQVRLQERLAIFLALIAGYVDATGFVKWKTYVSFMSGNTTQLGAGLSSQSLVILITTLTVISSFLIGIYLGTCLFLCKMLKVKLLSFYVVAGILMIYTIIAYFYSINNISSVAIIGFSMGIMNTIITSVGNQKVNTDFVTGTLTSLARNTALLSMTNDVAEREEYKSNAIHLLLLWISFLSGAIFGPIMLGDFGNWTLAFQQRSY
ncbi:YoaK family protein [Pedobacter ginsengiterrae]|uniref:YoaK family protein n=1 Tax=Pedobacter ginsengiterrae TaxID=871696 RepID=A0ABP7Q7R6_9SPHI